jgi:hypothetical protein
MQSDDLGGGLEHPRKTSDAGFDVSVRRVARDLPGDKGLETFREDPLRVAGSWTEPEAIG